MAKYESTETMAPPHISWPKDLLCQYDKDGVRRLSILFNLTKQQEALLQSATNSLPVSPIIFDKILGMIGIWLTEGLIGALLFNLASQHSKIDIDELLIDATAMDRYLVYNDCREYSNQSVIRRASMARNNKILQHVLLHSKTLLCPSDLQKRYRATLLKIPEILNQYVDAVRNGKQLQVQKKSIVQRPGSPFMAVPIMPRDYPPVGERNQDTFEIREKKRKKLRLRWSQIASPCQLKSRHLNTVAHSNNLHVWSLNERRKDLVQLPRLTLSELSKHPDNLTIEDVTELREKADFLKLSYYKSFLNATEMGTDEHWTELLGHEITSPVLQQVTKASFLTYSNPKYKLTFSPWEPKPFWMLRRNPTLKVSVRNNVDKGQKQAWRSI